MNRLAIFTICLIATVTARPQEPAPAPKPEAHPAPLKAASAGSGGSTPIPIVSQTEEINPDGSFKYSYETGNGIKVEESAVIKPGPAGKSAAGTDGEDDSSIQVRQGSFSYTGPDGVVYTIRFTADDNGFQAQGDHIPTAPPVPADIAKSLGNQSDSSPNEPAAQPHHAAAPVASSAAAPAAPEAEPAPAEEQQS